MEKCAVCLSTPQPPKNHKAAKKLHRHLVETLAQPSAVFDLHFSPYPSQGDICAAVSSTGTISFFKLTISDIKTPLPSSITPARLQTLSTLTIPDLDETTFTYFAFHPTIPNLVTITTAAGAIILAQIRADFQSLEVLANPILKHSLEAWVVAFSGTPVGNGDEFTVFSGGDDSALRYTTYNLSQSASDEESRHTSFPPATLRGRHHTAGVTAILPLTIPPPRTISTLSYPSGSPSPLTPASLLLTGSYDDTLRVFGSYDDTRHAFHTAALHTTFARANLLRQLKLGGGVWRLSVIGEPSIASTPDQRKEYWKVYILASCMHAGARVLRLKGSQGEGEDDVEIEVVARFEEHKSMNYGSDWSRVESTLDYKYGTGRVVCVSTSFYDRLLCLWEARLA